MGPKKDQYSATAAVADKPPARERITYLSDCGVSNIILHPIPAMANIQVAGQAFQEPVKDTFRGRTVRFTLVPPSDYAAMIWPPNDGSNLGRAVVGGKVGQPGTPGRTLPLYRLIVDPSDADYDAIRNRIEGEWNDDHTYLIREGIRSYSPAGPGFKHIWRLDKARERQLDFDTTMFASDREMLLDALASKGRAEDVDGMLNSELRAKYNATIGRKEDPVAPSGSVEVGMATAGGAPGGMQPSG